MAGQPSSHAPEASGKILLRPDFFRRRGIKEDFHVKHGSLVDTGISSCCAESRNKVIHLECCLTLQD